MGNSGKRQSFQPRRGHWNRAGTRIVQELNPPVLPRSPARLRADRTDRLHTAPPQSPAAQGQVPPPHAVSLRVLGNTRIARCFSRQQAVILEGVGRRRG